MNSKLNRGSFLAALAIALTLGLLLAARGGNVTLDARATEPDKAINQPGAADPALDSLESVTYHG